MTHSRAVTVPHLVTSGATNFLANGDGDSLRAFKTRVEDAISHVADGDKVALLNEITHDLQRADGNGERLRVLLDFLTRQRRVIRGEL